ncbi:hypothetical protein [Flavicella sediminum]|uniref:hypothetical protein n=1 Tax=Flavicella sediminum TaxID=2585141 RepID=UPI00111F59B7|nr:hypothetical protein [Flavicella sediminum]
MVRYPHSAILVIKTAENEKGTQLDAHGDAVEIEPVEIPIIGRYEPNEGNKKLDYSAKFFTPLFDIGPFEKDGHYLRYEGKELTVVQIFPYQRHCEIWVE